MDPECVIPILKIWRIEKFNPVEVPDSLWGQFHTRDAYLILWITDKDEKQVPPPFLSFFNFNFLLKK